MGVTTLQTDQLFAERFAALDRAVLAGSAASSRLRSQQRRAASTCSGRSPERGGVASLYDFENGKPLFPAVDASYKFCLLSLAGKALREPAARYAFFLLDTADLDDPGRVFALSPEEISLINPNTRTLPIFRTRRDADLTAAIYRRIPVLWDEATQRRQPLGHDLQADLFNMTDDSDLFRTREELERRLAGNCTATSLPATANACSRCTRRRWCIIRPSLELVLMTRTTMKPAA